MNQPNQPADLLLKKFLSQKLDLESVRQQLIASGLQPEYVEEQVKAYRKLKNEKKQFTGFFCCGIGAVLGFIACLLSLTNPVPELYGFFLYGLTSFAILLIFAGLYFLFE